MESAIHIHCFSFYSPQIYQSFFLMNLLKIFSRATLSGFGLQIRGADISGRCGWQDKQKIPTHCKSFTWLGYGQRSRSEDCRRLEECMSGSCSRRVSSFSTARKQKHWPLLLWAAFSGIICTDSSLGTERGRLPLEERASVCAVRRYNDAAPVRGEGQPGSPPAAKGLGSLRGLGSRPVTRLTGWGAQPGRACSALTEEKLQERAHMLTLWLLPPRRPHPSAWPWAPQTSGSFHRPEVSDQRACKSGNTADPSELLTTRRRLSIPDILESGHQKSPIESHLLLLVLYYTF